MLWTASITRPEPGKVSGHEMESIRWCCQLDVVGGRQRRHLAVPEGRLIARMIIRVAAQHVEDHATVEFAQRGLWRREARADNLGKLCISSRPNGVSAETMDLRCQPASTFFRSNRSTTFPATWRSSPVRHSTQRVRLGGRHFGFFVSQGARIRN